MVHLKAHGSAQNAFVGAIPSAKVVMIQFLSYWSDFNG